jgi:hypothetical protein
VDSNSTPHQAHTEAVEPRWLAAVRAVIGEPLRTVWGRPVTLVRVDEAGLVFRTVLGREMSPVPIGTVGRAIAMVESGTTINSPWQLRKLAGVDLASYVWALLHYERFRQLLAVQTASAPVAPEPTQKPLITISADRRSYLIHVLAGPGDPRPAAAGATWDDEVGAWTLDRTTDDRQLRRARDLLADELPGGGESARPYVVETGTRLLVRAPFGSNDRRRAIRGGYWDGEARGWSFPSQPEVVRGLVASFGSTLLLSQAARALLDEASVVGAPTLEEERELDEETSHVEAESPYPVSVSVSTPALSGEFEHGTNPSGVHPSELDEAPSEHVANIYDTSAADTSGVSDDISPPVAMPPHFSMAALAWLDGDTSLLPPGAEDLSPSLTAVARLQQGVPPDLNVLSGPIAPIDAALVVAAMACAVHGALTPVALADLPPRDPSELEFATGANTLLAPALAFAQTERGHDGLVLAGVLLAAADGDGESVEAWAALSEGNSQAGAATFRWLASWRASPWGNDSPLSPQQVSALAKWATTAECGRLAFTAVCNGRQLIAQSLLAALVVRIGQEPLIDIEAEVVDPLEAARHSSSAHWPELAALAAEVIEDGDRLAVPVLAPKVDFVYVAAFDAAEAFADAGRMRTAWERLLRWYRARGEPGRGIEFSERLRYHDGFAVDSPVAVAYLLAEMGQLDAAVDGLVEAGQRLRPVRPADAEEIFREALLLAEHLPDGMSRVPWNPAGERSAARVWPVGKRLVLAGGTDRMRAWTMPLLERSGIPARWLTTDEAMHGDQWPASLATTPDFVVLLVRHIPHSITRRGQSAAPGIDLIPYPYMGASRLPGFLLDLVEGMRHSYRPTGS